MEFISAFFDAIMSFLTVFADIFNKIPWGDYVNALLDKLIK